MSVPLTADEIAAVREGVLPAHGGEASRTLTALLDEVEASRAKLAAIRDVCTPSCCGPTSDVLAILDGEAP